MDPTHNSNARGFTTVSHQDGNRDTAQRQHPTNVVFSLRHPPPPDDTTTPYGTQCPSTHPRRSPTANEPPTQGFNVSVVIGQHRPQSRVRQIHPEVSHIDRTFRMHRRQIAMACFRRKPGDFPPWLRDSPCPHTWIPDIEKLQPPPQPGPSQIPTFVR